MRFSSPSRRVNQAELDNNIAHFPTAYNMLFFHSESLSKMIQGPVTISGQVSDCVISSRKKTAYKPVTKVLRKRQISSLSKSASRNSTGQSGSGPCCFPRKAILSRLSGCLHQYGRGFRALTGWDGRLACRLNDGQDVRPTKYGSGF
jgi:hypothetical protein